MRCTLLLLLGIATIATAADRPDVLIADFEGKDYGAWRTTGTAFGPGPAQGTLANQMPVTGFLGKGLVNSYFKGDGSTGTLTSPTLTVQRKYINFLVGGGKAPGKTCINLLHEGKIVRTTTGPNDKPGGSEHLEWAAWDVSDLAGKEVTVQIVDEATGGWGHINIDHLVQSDRKKTSEPVTREFVIDKNYLHFPVKTGAAKRRVSLEQAGKIVREFEIELAEDQGDFRVFTDVRSFRGQKLTIRTTLTNESKALDAITASDELPNATELYRERLRPQFHFTSRRGWLNDPNGLVYDGTEWHLFYQHNPYGYNWGNMHWGHATSKDLVRWNEVGIALYPKQYGDWAFSGSAVLDKENTSGFGTKEKPPLVLAYTSTGRGECIAYSNDQGRTWTEYTKNPVVKHTGRDPKLLWHAASKQWVMAVYTEPKGKQQIAFHTSPDLKTWTFQSVIDNFFECPDLFELPVQGSEKERRWVLYAADGRYLLGQFDGKTFTKESGKHQLWHGNFYAAQSFDNAPNNRRVQIGWANGITFGGMSFNQQMTIPVELTLRQTPAGVRMFAEPVAEVATLRGKGNTISGTTAGNEAKTLTFTDDTFEVLTTLTIGKAPTAKLSVRGFDIVYDAAKQTLAVGKVVAPVSLVDGTLTLRVLVDCGSVEVFANKGEVALSVGHRFAEKANGLQVSGAGLTIDALQFFPLQSAWK